jgi:V8-like Glu-specific endopeptidase
LLTFVGICKLFLYFQTPSGTEVQEGTGWVIDNETLVTAGHCVYNMQHGHVTAVEAVLGYGETTDGVESRRGECVVVHWGWYKTFSPRYDLAFIRVTLPFEKARPIPWMETPITAKDMQVGVVGFPGDIPGRYMHQSECSITFNLAQSDSMLEYDLDTAGGTCSYCDTWSMLC